MKTSWIKMVAAPLALAALFACSNGAGTAPPALEGGKHAAGWVVQHWVEYNKTADTSLSFDPSSSCAECHGSDGNGGISKVSCLSGAPQNGQSCHAVTLGHPAGWSDPAVKMSGFFHGQDARLTSPGIVADCGMCHALDANGTSVSTAPSCLAKDASLGFSCHVTSPAAHPSGCVSCHGGPSTGPTGTTAPNRIEGHTKHLALPGVVCDSCHSGAGTGTANHAKISATGGYVPATVSMNAVASVSGMPFSYTNKTCTGASCHGGLTTPVAWDGAAFDVYAHCDYCHTPGNSVNPPPSYISYRSGQNGVPAGSSLHYLHLTPGLTSAVIQCLDCHNLGDGVTPGKLQPIHFTAFDTATLPTGALTSPANTIGGATTKITNDYAGKTCLTPATGCHILNPTTDARSWN